MSNDVLSILAGVVFGLFLGWIEYDNRWSKDLNDE